MKTKNLIRLILVMLLGGTIIWAFIHRSEFEGAALEDWLQGFGVWSAPLFVGIYTIATVLFLPGLVFGLAGGVLFGPVWGTFYNLTAGTLGATIAFLISRYVAHDWVSQKTGGRLKQLVDGIEEEGWRFVAFVRLVPLFPFNLLNYALGLTKIKLWHYILVSYICMFPGTLAYTYLGALGRDAVSGNDDTAQLIQKGLLGLGFMAVVIFIPRLIKRLRNKQNLTINQLKQSLDKEDDLLLLDVRDVDEWSQGHIAGGLNVPLNNLSQRIDELDNYHSKPIAVICHTAKRSAKAVDVLKEAGFSNVFLVKGGMKQWNAKGFPLALAEMAVLNP